ncbi:MAG: fibronectin type III domain-containing protein [Bacteroidaceae bacterium]|nr:fibronectin type III domain-containing protein [Bacteroidaceae bacterium]
MAEDKQTNIYHHLYHKEPGHSTYEQVFGYMYDYVDSHKDQYNRTFENLQPGTHGFKVVVYDAAGNQSEYNPLTYTIPESAAPTLPSPYLYRYNITDQSVELKWERATDDMTKQSELKYRVFCRQKDGDKFVRVLHGVKDMTYAKVSGLKPNTWYEFLVDVYDTEANITYYESAFAKTLPTDYENDKEAPTLSNKKLTVTNATDNSLTLNWTKAKDNLFDDEDLDYTVMYKEASSGRYSKDGAEQGKNISSSHISSLQPNTTYEFYVRVKDGVGNTSTYDILTYTTSNTQDRTAPTISNKTVTATGATYGSVTLNWNKATDNVTKQENLQYSVFRDGVLCKKMKNETSYIVGDLKPSTKYTFEVRVEDEAGNISKYNTVQATTTAKPVTVTKYPLFIEGTQVTSANANDFWGDGGTIKYDPTTKTLHLNWADLYSTSNTLEINDDITINLVGWTTISGNINAASSSKVTIKADDNNGENAQLKIQNGYFYGNCDLTIKNECTVEIDATSKGNTSGLILNSHQLSVYGSTLKVKGDGKNATVSGISALSMTDCHITSDHKYAAASKTFLNASGGVAKDDVVISTEIIRVPVLVNDEIEVEGVTEEGALLSWIPATDDNTPQSDLDYTLYTMRRYGDTDYTGYTSGRNLTSCKLYNLQPNTEYYAIVRVADKDRNFTFYKETSFKTLPESDKKAPTLSNSAINVTDVTDNSVSISWAKASDDRTAQDKLIYFAGYKKSSEPESGWEQDVHNPIANGYDMTSCTAENLEPETSYDFYVVVYDGESNGATYTKKTVTTKALPDVTAPSLGEVTISVDEVTEKSIALTWSPATDDRTPQGDLVYTVEYKKASESVWNTRNTGNSTSYTIDGLTKGTDYDICISVADEAGNAMSYGQFTVTTTAPSAIDEVTAESGDEKMYSTSGVRVSVNFRGVVIKNGKKYFNK